MADAADATNGRHLTTLRLFADLPESDGSDEWDDESVVVGLRDEDDDSRYGRLACFGANDVTRSLGCECVCVPCVCRVNVPCECGV